MLVVVVLAAAWVAAPHVLDWATHTWYTVVRDRDLSASSAVSESASSGTQSTAASEPAASSVPEKEPEPEVKGTDIVTGLWAEVDVTTLTDEAAIRSAGARADHALAIRYQGQEYLWLDNKASAGGNPWLNPYAAETVQYIGDLIAEVHAAGFDQVLLENVQFPSSTSAKQDYGTTNGVAEVTGSSSQLGAPAAQLGVKNLLVKIPSSSTLDAAAREEMTLSLTEAGVEHVVIRDDAASYFE